LRHAHFYRKALQYLPAVVGLIRVRDKHIRTSTAGSSITRNNFTNMKNPIS
ncbi:hypothetical protein T07_8741, partial [Trichinella nelsoni]